MVLLKILTPKIPIYPERSHFMDYELIEFMKKAHNIKILNIAFTWMKRDNSKIITINKIKKDNAVFEILIVKRKRLREDFSFLMLREKDERNFQLRKNMNIVLFELFIFMLEYLYPMPQNGCEKGKKCHYNIKVMEYPFIPVMTMYIFDDTDLIFGPYISTNCDFIPMFHLKESKFQKEISRAYKELYTHYSILSKPNMRPDKQYVDKFCYFNGFENISIHTLIDNKAKELIDYLKPDIKTRYEQYLTDDNDELFHDTYIRNLGDEKLEGRFDAIMRHIENRLSSKPNTLTSNTPTPNTPTPNTPSKRAKNQANSKKKKLNP